MRAFEAGFPPSFFDAWLLWFVKERFPMEPLQGPHRVWVATGVRV